MASTGGLAATVRAGNDGRAALDFLRDGPREELRIDLTAPDAFDQLRELGASGGRILRLDGDTAVAEQPA